MQEFLIKMLSSTSGFSSGLGASINSIMGGGLSLFLLFFLLIIFLAALSFGKTRIVLALVATYIAAFLESIFLYQAELAKVLGDFLKLPASFWARLITFLVFFIFSFLILNRSILKPKMSLQESPPMSILFLSILQGIFWLSIVFSFLPAGALAKAGPLARNYLVLPLWQFIWGLVPLLALLFLKRKKTV